MYAKVWLTAFFLLLGGAVFSVFSGYAHVVADIEYLFPKSTADTLEAQAMERTGSQLSQRIVFLVGHKDEGSAQEALVALKEKLKTVRGISIPEADETGRAQLAHLQAPAIGALASTADFIMLKKGEGEKLIQRSLAFLYMPGSLVSSSMIYRDPLGLYQGYLGDMSNGAGSLTTAGDNGFFYKTLVALADDQLSSSAVKSDMLIEVDQLVTSVQESYPEAQIHHIGALYYSQRIAEISKSEASRITVLAIVGIIGLLFVIFRSFRPIFGALLIISIGVISGAATTIMLFGTVHLIAVAFGSSLIGVVVDYAIHYYSARRENETAFQTASRIRSGLILGSGTSLMGFVALAFADLDVLRQIAAYSFFGVAAAAVSVLLLLPLPHFQCQGRGFSSPTSRWRVLHQKYLTRHVYGAICTIPVCMAIILLLEIPSPTDKVQSLKVHTPQLSKTEALFRANSNSERPVLLFVKGGTSEQILQREEVLHERFFPLIKDEKNTALVGVSNFIPSMERQNQVLVLSKKLLSMDIAASLTALIPKTDHNSEVVALTPKSGKLLPDNIRDLQFINEENGRRGHIMILSNVNDDIDVHATIADIPWVSVLDGSETYSSGLREMREKATYSLLAGIAFILGCFVWRQGLRKGIAVMLAPACAALSAPAVAAMIGIEMNFFSVMACFLVFALGADYSLFQSAAHSDDKDRAYLAVSFSALSTLLVFGLLAFSAIPVLQTMGSVVVLGVIIAWLLAPVANTLSEGKVS